MESSLTLTMSSCLIKQISITTNCSTNSVKEGISIMIIYMSKQFKSAVFKDIKFLKKNLPKTYTVLYKSKKVKGKEYYCKHYRLKKHLTGSNLI